MTARVLVIPIFRRTWLEHVCSGAASRGPPTPHWSTGGTLQAKASLAAAGLREWGAAKVDAQWHKIQSAPEGTMNSYLFKLAQFVLRRVDPDESFLKDLPSGAEELLLHYPTSIPARLVRRRLRLLCRRREPFHRRRALIWAVSTIPQLPLAVLPLPNIPIYYSVWRAWSHRSAGFGARALMGALEAASDVQRYELALQLQRRRDEGGVALRPGEWPAQMVEGIDSLRAAAEAARARSPPGGSSGTPEAPVASGSSRTDASGAGGGSEPVANGGGEALGSGSDGGGGGGSGSSGSSSSSSSSSKSGVGGDDGAEEAALPPSHASKPRERPKLLPMPVFVADPFLEEVVRPDARWSTPLDEAAVRKIMERWDQDHLYEHFKAAQIRCLPKDAAEGAGGSGEGAGGGEARERQR